MQKIIFPVPLLKRLRAVVGQEKMIFRMPEIRLFFARIFDLRAEPHSDPALDPSGSQNQKML
jgi:hypothetical protein